MNYIFILSWLLNSTVPNLQEVRSLFKGSVDSNDKSQAFLEITKDALQTDDPLFIAYHGAAFAIRASHCSIFSKLTNFNKGKRLIEKAIQMDSNNIEIRTIRLSIQFYSPGFLGYNTSIDKDKKFILNKFKQLNKGDLKTYIEGFIENSSIFKETNQTK